MAKWLESTEQIKFAVRDRIARITLNRPEKRNALGPELIRELYGALMEADDLTDVSVIILEGEGKDFCAGYDLAGTYSGRMSEEKAKAAAVEASRYRSLIQSFDDDCWKMERMQDQTLAMFSLHKPVIAKIHGNCLAGGTDIAFMCDMVIAAEDCRIGFPATRGGGTPTNHMWVYHLGPQWAKRMLMTGDSLLGRDAARLGLVLDAVPADQLDAAVDELARRVALTDPELLSVHKRVVNQALELMGAKTLQRMAVELDARAHVSQGPQRKRFKKDFAEGGLKTALKNRDMPYGDGLVKFGGSK